MRTVLDPWRRTTGLAAGLVLAGFGGIAIAWVGVAATLSVPTQVAFVVSGGMGGFALAGAGLALFDIQRRRYAAAEARRDLVAFSSELADIAELLVARRSRPARRRRVLQAR